MRAMVLESSQLLDNSAGPLVERDYATPVPRPDELLIRVSACGVCHTELDVIEGRTLPSVLPLIPGHQVVGRIQECGRDTSGWQKGERVGIAWIYSACGRCEFCQKGQENLCPHFCATGRDAAGGYAEFMVAPAAFVYRIPDQFDDVVAAPLLCAGAVGYRALRLATGQGAQRLGFMGFGASAHLMLQLARHLYPHMQLYVFARNEEERKFARELGAHWAGGIHDTPPWKAHAIIDTTPAWLPVINALRCLEPGGRLVINAIRKEDQDKRSLLELDFAAHLWLEKEIKTVANIARADVREFLECAARFRLSAEVQTYRLAEANDALRELREKHIRGAKVLTIP